MAEKKKLPIRIKEIPLNGDWAGWNLVARVNPPLRIVGDILSGNIDRITEALAEVIKSWDFVDEEGEPLGEPSAATISELPIDLIKAVSNAFSEEVQKVPNG